MSKNASSAGGTPEKVRERESYGVDRPANIWIIGKNHFQNCLMEAFLKENLPPPCNMSVSAQWTEAPDDANFRDRLYLLDCFGIESSQIWHKLALRGTPDPWTELVVLFNVESAAGADLERQAIEKNSVVCCIPMNRPTCCPKPF